MHQRHVEELCGHLRKAHARAAFFKDSDENELDGDIDLIADKRGSAALAAAMTSWSECAGLKLIQVIRHGPAAWALIFANTGSGTVNDVISIDIHFAIHQGLHLCVASEQLPGKIPSGYYPNARPSLSQEASFVSYLVKRLAKRNIESRHVKLLSQILAGCDETQALEWVKKNMGRDVKAIVGRMAGATREECFDAIAIELTSWARSHRLGFFDWRGAVDIIAWLGGRIFMPVGLSVLVPKAELQEQLRACQVFSHIFPGGIRVHRSRFGVACLLDRVRRRLVLVPCPDADAQGVTASIISRLNNRIPARMPRWLKQQIT